MYNFRMALNSTCTSEKIIDMLSATHILQGVKYPTYSEIIDALSSEGYFCYAEPVETFTTDSRMAWFPVVKYMVGTRIYEESFQDMHIGYIDAIEESISDALGIILAVERKYQLSKYGEY